MGWHIVITEEMRSLGLSGNDLVVFALINGFSQDGQGCFYGSLSYICETCGIARRTAVYILQELVEKGLITKNETMQNGVKYVAYQASAKYAQVVQKLHSGSAEIAPKNKEYIKINKDTIKEGKFNFKYALVQIGVSEEVADAWLQVRKTKRATNTEIAFKAVCEEIKKSGLSPNECITIAVQNSWQGFKAMWIEGRSSKSAPKAQKKESVFEHNLKVMDQLYGTDLHSQAYGKKEVYDEQ